jgi:hypothetical protein
MMNKMILTAAAAFALATGAQAQYYNFDVTVHQDPTYPPPPSLSEIMANDQMIAQQQTVQFRNSWFTNSVTVKELFG